MRANTYKAVKAALKLNGISCHRICGEFKVYVKGTIGQAYFTTDALDALETGLDMARRNGSLVGPDGTLIATLSRDAVVNASVRMQAAALATI